MIWKFPRSWARSFKKFATKNYSTLIWSILIGWKCFIRMLYRYKHSVIWCWQRTFILKPKIRCCTSLLGYLINNRHLEILTKKSKQNEKRWFNKLALTQIPNLTLKPFSYPTSYSLQEFKQDLQIPLAKVSSVKGNFFI